MSRSKKWRLEWAFFPGENGRQQYNKLCQGCVYDCKQSFRTMVMACPHYLSLRSPKRGNWAKKHEENAYGGFSEYGQYGFPCWVASCFCIGKTLDLHLLYSKNGSVIIGCCPLMAYPLLAFSIASGFTKFELAVMVQYFHTILRTCLRVYYEAIRVLKH
jgi:hypothetical protein